jgi:hypothetical protein
MFNVFGRLAPDPADGIFSAELWTAGLEVAVFVVIVVVAFSRASHEGVIGTAARATLVLAGLIIAVLFLNDGNRRDEALERQALEARALELATHGALPTSPLACLDGAAGEAVESACEKALFASPETTAAAMNYVATQLALLADYHDHLRRGRSLETPSFINLRRAAEADRYGFVAQVLAARERCTPAQCPAFALLHDINRVSANMSERVFEFNVAQYSANWPSGGKPVATAAAPGTPNVVGRASSGELFFPSSASIPPVSIMTAEPSEPPGAATGTSSAAKQTSTASRKAAPPPPTSRAPLDLNAARSQSSASAAQ